MAVKKGIDLNFGELFNACVEVLSVRPSLVTEYAQGYVYFNSTSNKFEGYTGSIWVELGGVGTGNGDIKSDGSVNFVAAETWDDGGGATTVISPGAVVVNSGLYQAEIQNNLFQVQNSLTNDQARMQADLIGVTDGNDVLSLSKTIVSVVNGTTGTSMTKDGVQADYISEYTASNGTSINGVVVKGGKVQVGAGSASDVAIRKGSATGTGIYWDAANTISIAAGGTDALHMNGTSGYVKTTFLFSVNEINAAGATTSGATGAILYNTGSDKFDFVTAAGPMSLYPDTGWTLPTGTASKAGFDADAPSLGAVAQTLKAVMNHLQTNLGIFAT